MLYLHRARGVEGGEGAEWQTGATIEQLPQKLGSKPKKKKRTAVRVTKATMNKPGRRHLTSTGGKSRWAMMSTKLIHATKGGWSKNSTLNTCQLEKRA